MVVDILYFDKDTNKISVDVGVDGGVLYVYINGKFKQSFGNYVSQSEVEITNIVSPLDSGDIITVLYFVDNFLYSGDNSELIFSDKVTSAALKKVNTLDYFSNYDQIYFDQIKENLLAKVKDNGVILNDYLLEDVNENEDFNDFWSAIISYLILFKIAANGVVKGLFGDDKNILSTFLSQRNLFLSGDETIDTLNDLKSNLYREITKRGTFLTFKEKDVFLGFDEGEFLKLIRKDNGDELLINLYKDENFGFNVGNSSPMYRGLESESEIYAIGTEKDVSPFLDYRIEIILDGVGTLDLSLITKDIDSRDINNTRSTLDGSETNKFFENLSINGRTVLETFVFNKGKEINPKNIPNIGVGNNLIFGENNFKVELDKIVTGSVSVESIKIGISKTPYSRGFVQVNNFISAFYKNNSYSTVEEIDSLTEKFLLPYHSHWKSTQTNETLEDFPCQGTEEPNWQKTGRIDCEKILGVNTGKYSEEEVDLNDCTGEGIRWIEVEEFNYKKCPQCLPNGSQITIGMVTCDCKTVTIGQLSCGCVEATIAFISCQCEIY